MTDNDAETADDNQQIERQARAMHDAIAQKHDLPLWDEAGEEMRAQWLHAVRVMHERNDQDIWRMIESNPSISYEDEIIAYDILMEEKRRGNE